MDFAPAAPTPAATTPPDAPAVEVPLNLANHDAAAVESTGQPGSGRTAAPVVGHLRLAGRRCAALNSAGRPCLAPPLTTGNLCRYHAAQADPVLAAQVHQTRIHGGRAAQALMRALDIPPAQLDSPAGCRAILEKVADAVIRGRLTSSQAQAVSALVSTAIRAAELQVAADLAVLERRLDAEVRR